MHNIGEARIKVPDQIKRGDVITVNSIAPYTPQSSPSSAPVSTASDGFDWGDAGIGATVVLALAAMVGGTTLVLRNRPHRGSIA